MLKSKKKKKKKLATEKLWPDYQADKQLFSSSFGFAEVQKCVAFFIEILGTHGLNR